MIGDGHNFVRTMAALADRGVEPGVVDDQFGRLTFTDEIARAIRHLLDVGAPYGTYNVTSDGPADDLGRHRPDGLRGPRRRPGGGAGRSAPTAYGDGKAAGPAARGTARWTWTKITATGFRPAPVDQSLAALSGGVWDSERPAADRDRTHSAAMISSTAGRPPRPRTRPRAPATSIT